MISLDASPGLNPTIENSPALPKAITGESPSLFFPNLQSSIYNPPWPMDTRHIADLLQPFLAAPVPATASEELSFRAGFSLREPALSGSRRETAVLSETQLQNISMYIDILLRWNERINLTAVRQPEHIVTRHFGESLFVARHLFPILACGRTPPLRVRSTRAATAPPPQVSST